MWLYNATMVCMCISSCLYLCSRLPCLQFWWLQSQFELPVDRPSFWHLMSNVALVNPHLLLVKQDNHVHVHACAHYITHTHTHTSQIVYHALPSSMSRFINQCFSSHTVCLDKHMRHPPKIDGLVSLLKFTPKNDGHLWLPGSGQDTAASSAGVNCGICARPQRIRRTWDRCWEGPGANRAG